MAHQIYSFDNELANCYISLMTPIRVGDIIIFLLAVALIIGSFSFYSTISGKPEVRVKSGAGESIYDLSVDTQATFKGPVGETTIEIRGGQVHVSESDCRNKVCISAGWISSPGEWIICLPNNVFVRIEGSLEEGSPDDTSF